MGLDIYGNITSGHLGGSYSRLHYCTRYLALLYCGMPEFLDSKNEVQSMVFYMSGYIGNKEIIPDRIQSLMQALECSGNLFPNIMLHSDCEGNYTKNGKIDINKNWFHGNSIKLMKELEILVNEDMFKDEKYSRQIEYTKAFYELVKKEISDGSGTIIFS